jgi:hypothetical protein
MFFYLEDHATGIILFIDNDPFIVKNLKSGILDCNIFSFDSKDATVTNILDHLDKESNEGIKLQPFGLKKFDLTEYPEIKNKIHLLRIRSKAFKILQKKAEIYRSKNCYGFHPADIFSINTALTSQDRIDEYAQVMNINPRLARQELEMISESAHTDQFRIFTVCEMWKSKINKTTTSEEVETLIEIIIPSFFSPGITNG